MGTLKGFAFAFGPAPATPPALASLGLAIPSRALAPAGKARLRQRDHGNPERVPMRLLLGRRSAFLGMRLSSGSKGCGPPRFRSIARNHPHAGSRDQSKQVLQGEGVDVGRLVPMVGQPFGDWHTSARHQRSTSTRQWAKLETKPCPGGPRAASRPAFRAGWRGSAAFLQHHHVECLTHGKRRSPSSNRPA